MKAIITPSKVSGSVIVPPSKSFTHRAVLLASLAGGVSVIRNPLICDDTMHTIAVCNTLGASVKSTDGKLEIKGCGGKFNPRHKEISVGGSGSTMRMASSLAALAKGKMRFVGNERLNQRPVQDLVDALNSAGISAKAENGCPPLEIEGGMFKGGEIVISGDKSSQFISSLLMIAPYAKESTKIIVKGDLVSKPYVDITIDMMRRFGVRVGRCKYSRFFVPNWQKYKAIDYRVEGDWSSASYYLAAAAICKTKMLVNGLNSISVQGDRFFSTILQVMGNSVNWHNGGVSIEGKNMGGIIVSMKSCPDTVQTAAAVAAFSNGDVCITDIGHLTIKESDRINDTKKELEKMGVRVEATDNSITIHGGNPKGAEVDSHNDHRMAMVLTAVALGAEGETVINGAECVSKSFPDFFDKMKSAGAKIELVE